MRWIVLVLLTIKHGEYKMTEKGNVRYHMMNVIIIIMVIPCVQQRYLATKHQFISAT